MARALEAWEVSSNASFSDLTFGYLLIVVGQSLARCCPTSFGSAWNGPRPASSRTLWRRRCTGKEDGLEYLFFFFVDPTSSNNEPTHTLYVHVCRFHPSRIFDCHLLPIRGGQPVRKNTSNTPTSTPTARLGARRSSLTSRLGALGWARLGSVRGVPTRPPTAHDLNSRPDPQRRPGWNSRDFMKRVGF